MQVVTTDIGKLILKELKGAADVKLAVAYFTPPEDILEALCAAPSLALVISDEYAINNPYKIEKLPQTFFRGCIQTGNKKLHAKVLIVQRHDGSSWVLLGSANMTSGALNWNREACVAMESTVQADAQAVAELVKWFDTLKKSANEINLESAKKVFDARAKYQTIRRTDEEQMEESDSERKYWVLKTRNGGNREEHWDQFEQEDVVAIGWEGINVNPAKASSSPLI
jgi:phosphatidylserine/phosphatidylglycerophosphate/cardiolipin synthase-like enzyme